MSLWRKFVTFAAVVGVMVIGGGFASAETDTHAITYTVISTRSITVKDATVTLGNIGRNDATGVTGTLGLTNGSDPALVWATDNASNDKIQVSATGIATGSTLVVSADGIDDSDTPCGTGNSEGALVDDSDFAVTASEANYITGISNCPTAGATSPNVDQLTYKVTTSGATLGAANVTVSYEIRAA